MQSWSKRLIHNGQFVEHFAIYASALYELWGAKKSRNRVMWVHKKISSKLENMGIEANEALSDRNRFDKVGSNHNVNSLAKGGPTYIHFYGGTISTVALIMKKI